jgi:hypothetical protein
VVHEHPSAPSRHELAAKASAVLAEELQLAGGKSKVGHGDRRS